MSKKPLQGINPLDIFMHARGFHLAEEHIAGLPFEQNMQLALEMSQAGSFFGLFPNESLEKEMKTLLKIYKDGASRRNDIAHGLAMPRGHLGYQIQASIYTVKRDLNWISPYSYSSRQIEFFQDRFHWLGGQANEMLKKIDVHFFASPEKSRRRYLPHL